MLQKALDFIKKTFRFHKKKIFFALGCAWAFFILRFPYDDLADYVTGTVSRATQDQVFLQFDQLGLSLFPSLGIKLHDVSIDTAQFPALKAERLLISPSITSLLALRMGGSVEADGFFKGEVNATLKQGSKIEDSTERMMSVSLDAEDVDLSEVKKTFPMPINILGKLNGEIDADVDPTFKEQPKADMNLELASFRMPSSVVNTQFGPFNLPDIKLSQVKVTGRLAGNDFLIDNAKFGEAQDPLYGRIKGRMGVTFQRRGVSIVPSFGSYELSIELNVKKSVAKELGVFLGFIDKHKAETLAGTRYLFKVTSPNFYAPPQMTTLSSF